jgi:hypothetical protein
MKRRTPWARGAVVILVVALCGCDQEDPDWTVHSRSARGYTVEFPDSWQVATERMSRLSEPRELFSVGTAALEWKATNCEAFAGAAGASMDRADVVVTVWERGYDGHSAWSDFPARPASFGPVGSGDSARGCGEPQGTVTHWRNFREAGRHFHTLVRIGPDAPQDSREDAWRILDSLRLDEDYRPGWPASE